MTRERQLDPQATLLSIAAAMPQRTEPLCPHFGTCGGCSLQHLPYQSQLAAKRALVHDVLVAHGIDSAPEVSLHSAAPYGYRNRVRMRVVADAVGYSMRESNAFLPIDTCPIASPLLERIAFRLRDAARSKQCAWPLGTSAFELFTDGEETAVQLGIHLDSTVATVERDAPLQFRTLCEVVAKDMPQLIGAGLLAAAPDLTQSRRVQSTQRAEIARWGAPNLTYTVAHQPYVVTRNAFFQVNRFLTAEMVRAVTASRGGQLAFDLFAGAGLFSVPLTRQFTQVVAVEIGEPSASDLQRNLATAGPAHRAVRSTVQDFLTHESHRPDLVVMDPPRAGVPLPALRSLARLAPREIVYISCDLGTFARDAKTLLESGYILAALHLLDIFPQTVHTETVAVFRL